MAAGGWYPTSGSSAASSEPSSCRLASSPRSRLSSHGVPDRNAPSDAITPNSPEPNWTSSGIRSRSGAPSGPVIASAALSPARFHAFDADTNTTAGPASGSDRYGTNSTPGYVSGAWISSTSTRTPWRSASAAIDASRAADSTRPVGLCGLHSR